MAPILADKCSAKSRIGCLSMTEDSDSRIFFLLLTREPVACSTLGLCRNDIGLEDLADALIFDNSQ